VFYYGVAALKRITFVADQYGLVVRADTLPEKKRPLTREERIEAYKEGIKRAATILRENGFQTHYECEHSVSMHYAGVLIDFRCQRPGNVAHVTSWTADSGRPKAKHGGCVYKLADEIKSEFALQIILGKESSGRPIYVALDETLEDPATHIVSSIMNLLASLRERNDRLGSALKQKQLGYDPTELPEWL
jgi:hypothetical protein